MTPNVGTRTAAHRPGIEFSGGQDALLGGAYRSALSNLLDVNTVAYDPAEYDRTGLLQDPPGLFIRAGGGYEQPWTRDAAVNTSSAGSLLWPEAARNTLWSVCRRLDDGTPVVQQDDQWWDQVVWTVGAWSHHLVTGDRAFLADAYETSVNTLRLCASRLNRDYGLFEGPAFLQDGIAGYPSPPYDPAVGSSFVLDHPGTGKLMCLSTNCLYYAAYEACAEMAAALGRQSEAGQWQSAAGALRTAINTHLWRPEASSYGYFVHGAGEAAGRLEPHQEVNGLAFAVLFGVASPDQVRAVLDSTHREPFGVVNVWPHFARFDDEHPGRHNAVVWPMSVGMWGHAAAVGGRVELFAQAVTDIARLAEPDGRFWEIHHARTGAVDGGWQNDRQGDLSDRRGDRPQEADGGRHVARPWRSEEDQTWSATAYLRLIHLGLFGLRFERDGLRFAPSLPEGWGPVTLTGIGYRGMTLDITLAGSGRRITSLAVDGQAADHLPAHLQGRHQVHIELS